MRRSVIAAVGLWLLASLSAAERFQLAHTFTPADSEPGDLFGSAVEIEGDLAVIRSHTPYDGIAGDPPNQTHIFRQSPEGDWLEEQVIKLNGNGLWSGREVAIDGGDIVIGASSGSINGESTIDFFGNDGAGWETQALLPYPAPDALLPRDAPESLNWRAFQSDSIVSRRTVDADNGKAVAISGYLGRPPSSVLIYQQESVGEWRELTTIPDSFELPGGDRSIETVAIDAGVIAVGYRAGAFSEEVVVAIHEQVEENEWELTAFFTKSDSNDRDWILGIDVAPNRVVAASLDQARSRVFARGADGDWALEADLSQASASPGFEADAAAWRAVDSASVLSVKTEGDLIAEGILAGENSHVRIYRRDESGSWWFDEVIPAPNPATAEDFAFSLSLDEGRLLVGGSNTNPDPTTTAGAAYLYVLVPEPASAGLALMAAAALLRSRRSACRP